MDDLFFIKDCNWKNNVKDEYYNHIYLIYHLFKNPEIGIIY